MGVIKIVVSVDILVHISVIITTQEIMFREMDIVIMVHIIVENQIMVGVIIIMKYVIIRAVTYVANTIKEIENQMMGIVTTRVVITV
jgi:hypothetical protein